MKKLLVMLLALCFVMALAGCQKSDPEPSTTEPLSYANTTATFVGDSITFGCTLKAGEKIYWQLASEALGFKNAIGMGVNGSCYSTTSDYGLDNSPLTMRYQEIPQTDLIFIALATNDFYQNTPLGTIEDQEDVSFYGAINFVLNKLEQQCPNSKIILIAPIRGHGKMITNKAGHKYVDYIEAIKAVGEKRQLTVMDMYTLTYDTLLEGFFNDIVHPNQYGNQQMGEVLKTWLEAHMEALATR